MADTLATVEFEIHRSCTDDPEMISEHIIKLVERLADNSIGEVYKCDTDSLVIQSIERITPRIACRCGGEGFTVTKRYTWQADQTWRESLLIDCDTCNTSISPSEARDLGLTLPTGASA